MKKTTGALLYSVKFILLAIIFVFGTVSISFLHKCGAESSRGVFSSSNTTPITVVIDPGHGGRDGGATALSNVPEKELNLNIALYLRDMLKCAGINVVLTRDEDIMLEHDGAGSKKSGDLIARREIAQSVENAIFVSIHMNSFPIEKYRGLQVYYSQNNTLSESLAAHIQSCIKNGLQRDNDRKIKPAGDNIFLLDQLDCPAVLIECGFLSNASEASMLCDTEYQRILAFYICSALIEFISESGG